MFRKQISSGARERKDLITWRSHEVTRIEAFSDAVIAFSITLLIVSLEVPHTFEEMMKGMYSFVPFGICFFMVFQIWLVQNIFFRRYGLTDNLTITLNGMLLFTVLFFVYPLKFLFNSWLLDGFSHIGGQEIIELFYIYSGSFATIYLLFAMMYWNALHRRVELGLTASEVFETKTNIYRNLVMAAIGLLSVAAAFFGPKTAWLAGMIYMLIGPAIAFTHGHRGKIHRRKHETPKLEKTAQTADQ